MAGLFPRGKERDERSGDSDTDSSDDSSRSFSVEDQREVAVKAKKLRVTLHLKKLNRHPDRERVKADKKKSNLKPILRKKKRVAFRASVKPDKPAATAGAGSSDATAVRVSEEGLVWNALLAAVEPNGAGFVVGRGAPRERNL